MRALLRQVMISILVIASLGSMPIVGGLVSDKKEQKEKLERSNIVDTTSKSKRSAKSKTFLSSAWFSTKNALSAIGSKIYKFFFNDGYKYEMMLQEMRNPDGKVISCTIEPSFESLPIKHLIDIDLDSAVGHALVAEIYKRILLLSKKNNNADFALRIYSKHDQLVFAVVLDTNSEPNISQLCSFCGPLHLKGGIINQNLKVVAFEKSNPARKPIDFLIASQQHIVNYKDPVCTVDIFIAQLAMAQKLAQKLIDPTAIKLQVNNGANVGQQVFHSHMHFRSSSNWKS